MRSFCFRSAAAAAFCVAAARAQDAAPKPAFDAASIKPNGAVSNMAGLRLLPGGRLEAQNITLKFLIQNAYRVQPGQITGGPGWIAVDRYDLTATPGPAASRDQVALMLQSLLEERFQLKVHREQHDMPVYLLVPAKSGLKLTEPKEGSCAPPDAAPKAKLPPPEPGRPHAVPCGAMMMGINGIDGSRIAMAQLASALTNVAGRTVIDRTGFAGTFDVHLEFAREGMLSGDFAGLPPPAGLKAPPSDPNAPSVFTALEDQLGLKLESGRAPLDVLVIDHAEKPGDN